MLKKIRAVSKDFLKKEKFSSEVEHALKSSRTRPMVYMGKEKALTETIFGHSLTVNTNDVSLAPHILMKGYWEIWITNFFIETIREGMNVLEIGSNIGYYTVLAASKVGKLGKVYAFEADSENYEILHRNIEINGFLDKVILINKAVLDKDETVKFYKLSSHHGSNSIINFEDSFLMKYRDKAIATDVSATSLDSFFSENNPTIDLLKIDAEGSEPRIFRGMQSLLAKNPEIKVVCEFAPDLISKAGESSIDFLRYIQNQLSFKLSVIESNGKASLKKESEIMQLPHCELYLER